MSTTASRGFKTPLEIVRAIVPDITKLHRFYTCSFVCIPRQKRKQLAGKGFIGRAEVGRLMWFRSPFSTTYRVLLSENRMVHNTNMTFDDSNCTNKTVCICWLARPSPIKVPLALNCGAGAIRFRLVIIC